MTQSRSLFGPREVLRLGTALIVCLTSASMSFGEDPESQQQKHDRRELTITPAQPPMPSLRYELLPTMQERKPGNRAPYYLRSLIHWYTSIAAEAHENFRELTLRRNEVPLDAFPADDVREMLASFDHILRQLEHAAVRSDCNWNLGLEGLEGWDAISFSLEEFQRSRELARLLRLKARLELSEGRFDDCERTLRIGYQLARDVGEPPTIINSLIGIAIASIMNEILVEWIDQPGAPNLYWALATRPRPFIDVDRQFRFEASIPERMFPVLRNPEQTGRTAEEWNRQVRQILLDLEDVKDAWEQRRPEPTPEALSHVEQVIAEALPVARRELAADGFSEERLQAMSEGQILAIHTSRFTRERFDRMLALLHIPYPQSTVLMEQFEDEIKRIHASSETDERRESLPVAGTLMPSMRAAVAAAWRLEQRMDALQCLEAVRAASADRRGRLPSSLEEIVETPCPIDVTTGAPFEYRVDGEKASLTVPPVPAGSPQTGREYVLRVR